MKNHCEQEWQLFLRFLSLPHNACLSGSEWRLSLSIRTIQRMLCDATLLKGMAIDYLNNRMFERIIVRFRLAKKNLAYDEVEFYLAQAELTDAFYLLTRNIVRAFKFRLVDNEDAVQEGVMICFSKLHRFNPDKGRAFNFCTTIIINHFRQLYRSAKNYNLLKERYTEHLLEQTDEVFLDDLVARRKIKLRNQH